MNERILVIQTAFIGDAILTLPMIQKLKENYPQSHIDVIAIPSTSEIFRSSPFVNDTIVLDKRNKHKSIRSLIKFAKELRSKNYSFVYSPHRSFRTALLVLLLNTKVSFGFETASLRHVYKNLIKYSLDEHEVKRNLKLAGFNSSNEEWRILPQINIGTTIIEKINNEIIFFAGKKLAAIAPGSVWETKKYPFEYFYEIIKYLVSIDYFVILIGGKEDIDLCDALENKFNEAVKSFAGSLSLIESIELLKRCKFLVCNDSAPTHMGMCVDIPTITIYCSTSKSFGFYPYNEKSISISYDDLECKPCGIHGYKECPIKTFDCGINLKPKKVIDAIKKIV